METKGEVAGLLLAAGGGRRLGGRPKALLPFGGRPLVEHVVRVLRAGGCGPVHVVLGAAAAEVRERADLAGCVVVENPDWRQGMGSSLRAGLASLAGPAAGSITGPVAGPTGDTAPGVRVRPASRAGAVARPAAALIGLVDQPGVGAAAVSRVLATAPSGAACRWRWCRRCTAGGARIRC